MVLAGWSQISLMQRKPVTSQGPGKAGHGHRQESASRACGDLSSSLPQARWFPKTPAKSVVALTTPIKVELVAGKTYRWCVCGRSKKQVRDLYPPPR